MHDNNNFSLIISHMQQLHNQFLLKVFLNIKELNKKQSFKILLNESLSNF